MENKQSVLARIWANLKGSTKGEWELGNFGQSLAAFAIPLIIIVALVGGIAAQPGAVGTFANSLVDAINTVLFTQGYFQLLILLVILLGIYGLYLYFTKKYQ
jgi:hypothetical protein